MSLVAIRQDTGERFDATVWDRDYLRHTRATKKFTCQLCGSEMILKPGNVVVPHFSHKAGECTTEYNYHPQSAEHYTAKLFISDRLYEFYGKIEGVNIEKEVRLPEAMRVADVMITFPTGEREAHEAQLARLSTDDLQTRSEAYLAAGIQVVWYFGERANTNENRIWCREHDLQFYEIEISQTSENIDNVENRSYQYDGDIIKQAA